MKPAPSLTIRGVCHDADQILRGVVLVDATPNEASALAFCKAWLSGASHFRLHTSGSTGVPKPVDLTHSQMEASARGTIAALALTSEMRALVCLPTQYIAGTMMLVRGLSLGMAMHLVEPSSNPLLGIALPFDFAAFVPMQIAAILDATEPAADAAREHLDRAHAVLIGGGVISTTLERGLESLRVPCYHTYGMTETVSHVALRRLNGAQRSDRFVPLPGVEVALDARGCLRVRGGMTDGAWVQTNDLVDLSANGEFRWLGRIDNVINSGGVKIGVETLEAQLEPLLAAHFGGVAPRFIVAGAADETLGQRVTLLLESSPLRDPEIETLLAYLRTVDLPRYHHPRAIHTLPRFAETPTGKIDRTATVAAVLDAR